jgi:hypothetical protein
MGGGRNGQEFGNALNETQNGGLRHIQLSKSCINSTAAHIGHIGRSF